MKNVIQATHKFEEKRTMDKIKKAEFVPPTFTTGVITHPRAIYSGDVSFPLMPVEPDFIDRDGNHYELKLSKGTLDHFQQQEFYKEKL